MQAPHTLGVIFFPAFDWAISPSHPERKERLLYTQDQFREEGLFDIEGISEHRPLRASDEDILATHFCFPGIAAVCIWEVCHRFHPLDRLDERLGKVLPLSSGTMNHITKGKPCVG